MKRVTKKQTVTVISYEVTVTNSLDEETARKLITISKLRGESIEELLKNCIRDWVVDWETRHGTVHTTDVELPT